MKKANKESRRNFLKSASTAAVASAVAGCKITGHQQGAVANVPLRSPRGNVETKKLNKLDRHKLYPNSAFKQLDWRRLPGWRPDTAEKSGKEEYYFPEEALQSKRTGSNEKFNGFPPPNKFPVLPPHADHRVPFKEPDTKYNPESPLYAQEWNLHNSWILGSPLNEKSPDRFDKFLTEIAKRVRKYNSALYWLRQLHFRENAVPLDMAPSPNPDGDTESSIESPGSPEFAKQVEDAEARWMDAVDELNEILAPNPTPGFHETYADMIEVNGYIVSMRIVTSYFGVSQNQQQAVDSLQIGGSSSSHIYISSPFCSAGC